MEFKRRFAPKIREFKLSFHILNKNVLTRFAMIGVVLLILIALFAPVIVPYASHIMEENNPADSLLPPSAKYFFGTDELGRDLFSRILYGTRISLSTAVMAVGFAIAIGVPLGAIAGTMGGIVDEVIMRVTDIFLSFPPLLLAITIAAYLGPNLRNAMIAIAISWWPWYTRLVRSQAVSIRERQFVKASEAIGSSTWTIIYKHIIPNCIAPVVVQASMDIGGVILTIASISFLGLGAQAPTPEWGLLVSTSKTYFLNAWWYSIIPGLFIFFTVLIFNLLGDGLREVLDPKTRNL